MKSLERKTKEQDAQGTPRPSVNLELIEAQREELMNLIVELAQHQFDKVCFAEDEMTIYYDSFSPSNAFFIHIPSGQETFMLKTCVNEKVTKEEPLTKKSVRYIIKNMEAAKKGMAI